MSAPFGLHMTHESRIVVMGLPRYGKTTLVRDVLTADNERVLFHDVTGHDYYAPGRLPLTISELEAHQYLLEQRYCRLVVIAETPGDPDSLQDETRRIIALAKKYRNMTLVFDELQAHHRKSENEINGIFARGSHHRIATVVSAQFATSIPLGARIACSECYCFGQHHPKELQALYDAYGDIFANGVAAHVKGAPPLHWTEDSRAKWWSDSAKKKFRGNVAAINPE